MKAPPASYLIFPVTLVSLLTIAIVAAERGFSPVWMLVVLSILAASIAFLGEIFLPFEPEWRRPRKDIGVDAIHMAVSQGIVPEVCKLLTFPVLFWIGAALSGAIGLGIWPEHWPLAAQLVLVLLVGEFGQYWYHRWAHEHDGILWSLHATHHSPNRLYWLNAGRDHPLGASVAFVASTIPLAIMGVTPEVLMVFSLFTAIHGLFQHANIDVRLGPLNWIFSMAELHRWHHSKRVEEANYNYGANIIFWDIVFGTRFLPDARPPADIGVGDMPNFPETYWGQIKSPFEWQRLRDEGRAMLARAAHAPATDLSAPESAAGSAAT